MRRGGVPRRSRSLLAAGALALSWIPGDIPAQEEPAGVADRQWDAGDVLASYETLKQALDDAPEEYALLWRSTRAAAVLGVANRPERETWLRRAVELADRAVAVDSLGPDAAHWRLYAMGELALNQGPRTAGRLATQVFEAATTLLARDSLNAYAHNALGRVNHEVMTLSGLERFLGKLVVGGRLLGRASWEEARTHLERAVELAPENPLFHTGLGAYYAQMGRGEEAKREFRAALALLGEHPWDRALARDAALQLDNALTWSPDPPPSPGPPDEEPSEDP